MSDGSNPGGPGGPDAARPRVSLFGRRAARKAAQRVAAPPPPRRPRKGRHEVLSRVSGVLSFILVGAIAGFVAFTWALREARKPGPLTADKVVVIEREDEAAAGTIADQLDHAGVIDSPLWFNLTVLADGNRGKLKRGEYLFKSGASMREVENTLVAGKPVQHALTIPEGLTSEQVVQRLRDDDVLVGEIKATPREGSILPETYKFPRGETREALLGLMEKAQTKFVDEVWGRRAADLPIRSPGELVTLASIVEKETGKADERPRVAGVYVTRLKRRMRLQSDPTIVYGLVGGKGTLGHPITRSELEQATPYNTYIIEGLPPGPITNPGKAALEAAANPSETGDLYFVADGTGGHVFATTFAEHLKNVEHWRQIEKDAKAVKDEVSPDLIPTTPAAPPARRKGALNVPDLKMFGALALSPQDASVAPAPPPHATRLARGLARIGADREERDARLAKALGRIGADRQERAALMGPNGALSAQAASRGLADSGAIVEGVNDEAQMGQAGADDDSGVSDSPQSYPLSPSALADQRAREARYGVAPAPRDGSQANSDFAPLPRQVATLPVGVHPQPFDASEGTPLDPLLNTTYDLNYAKTVPALN